MNVNKFLIVSRKYKKCPNCGSSWKDTKMKVELKDEVIEINCECGFLKRVDEDNNEL